MTLRFVVSGTDTGVGKTVFSAGLTDALNGVYWKPVQSGLDAETDSETVRRIGQIAPDRILPEAWRLKTPVSPHLAAQIDGVAISPDALAPPETDRPLIIEGAGGLLVPLTNDTTFADVFACWQIPVILCAGTGLGTINHTLLSLEAMRRRSIPIAGIAFIGLPNHPTEQIILTMGDVRILGTLPWIDPLSPTALRSGFRAHIDLSRLPGTGA